MALKVERKLRPISKMTSSSSILTWTCIDRIGHPSFPIFLANILIFSVRLTFSQFLRQIGRSVFGECGRHTTNGVLATAHILLDGFRYHFQQYATAVQVSNRFNCGHITRQYIRGVHAGMKEAFSQRFFDRIDEEITKINLFQASFQIVDGWPRIGKICNGKLYN